MKDSAASIAPGRAPRSTRKLSRDTVSMVGDLLPLCDFAAVLVAAWLATLAYARWFLPGMDVSTLWADGGRAALAAAVLAPLILCDRAFVSFASGGQTAAMIRCYAVRFAMFAGVVAALGLAAHALESLSGTWVMLWFATVLGITALTRLLLVVTLRRLEREGVLVETIAVVGAGPIADRLIEHLQRTRRDSVDIVGVYDDRQGWRKCGERQDAEAADRIDRSDRCVHKPVGTIADLVELGKSRHMDWILIALPASARARAAELTRSIVHRLKALAVPVALYPGAALLPGRPSTGWESALAAIETVVPRWIITLLGLPLATLRLLQLQRAQSRTAPLTCAVDDYDLERFTGVAARFGQDRFGYVVTPNADHLMRLHREPPFRASYADAAYILLDSRFIAHVLRLTRKLRLPVCTGSDLTAKLFAEVIVPDDRLVLIGGSDAQAARLAQRYGLKQLAHFNPPMGFIRDPSATEACLRFVEAHSPFRYCLLAVGAPQQEAVAQRLKQRGIARGLGLCIGASINFLTGEERRAPQWMQRLGIEWMFRLLLAPGRMARRYLVQGPRLFGLLRNTKIVLRAATEAPTNPVPAVTTPQRPGRARYGKRSIAVRIGSIRPGALARKGEATLH